MVDLHILQLKLGRVEAEIIEPKREFNLCFESGYASRKARVPSHKAFWEWYDLSKRQISGLIATRIMLKAKILEEERGAAEYDIEEGRRRRNRRRRESRRRELR